MVPERVSQKDPIRALIRFFLIRKTRKMLRFNACKKYAQDWPVLPKYRWKRPRRMAAKGLFIDPFFATFYSIRASETRPE